MKGYFLWNKEPQCVYIFYNKRLTVLYMDFKTLIYVIVVASTISITLVTATSVGQGVNAVLATTTKSATTTTPNGNNINCQSKNGSADTQTSLGNLRFAAGKCTGENGGTVSAGGITSTPTTSSKNINCQSNKGSANTANLGTLNFAAGKCTGENGGTVSAGGVKSNSGAIGMHGTNGPNGNSHVGGLLNGRCYDMHYLQNGFCLSQHFELS
jgi:hypothetical protein